jgi:hypothetical protein
VISFFERRTFDPNILVSSAVEISEAPQGTGCVGREPWADLEGQWSGYRRNQARVVNVGRSSHKNIE